MCNNIHSVCLYTDIFSDVKISDLIDRKLILKAIDINIEGELHQATIDYIDDYINYVFYKRSYPTININKIAEKTMQDKRVVVVALDSLKNKLNLKYEHILKIREINNILSNQSIYLLVNIGLFILFLIISIVNTRFIKGINIYSLASLIASIVILLTFVIAHNYYIKMEPTLLKSFLDNIINDNMKSNFFSLNIKYLVASFIFYFGTLIYIKIPRKK